MGPDPNRSTIVRTGPDAARGTMTIGVYAAGPGFRMLNDTGTDRRLLNDTGTDARTIND